MTTTTEYLEAWGMAAAEIGNRFADAMEQIDGHDDLPLEVAIQIITVAEELGKLQDALAKYLTVTP